MLALHDLEIGLRVLKVTYQATCPITLQKITMITDYPGCHEASPRRAVRGEHYELLTLLTAARRSSTLRSCGLAGLSEHEAVEAKIWLKSD
jgi:hypothetical protein